MSDKEQLERLYHACLALTRRLGDRQGYFPSVGAPDTYDFTDAVLAARKHLGDKSPVFAKDLDRVKKEDS